MKKTQRVIARPLVLPEQFSQQALEDVDDVIDDAQAYPDGTEVLEVMVAFGGDAGATEKSPVRFPLNGTYLPGAMQGNVRAVYLLGGQAGLDALRSALDCLPDVGNIPGGASSGWLPELQRLFTQCRKVIAGQELAAQKSVQKVAVSLALLRLSESVEEVLAETERYLDVSGRSRAKYILENGPAVWGFKPSAVRGEAEDLIAALIDIRKRFSKLSGNFEGGDHSQAAERFTELTHTLSMYCLKYPLLHRLYETPWIPEYDENTVSLLEAPAGKPAEALKNLKHQIFEILSSTYKAAEDLRGMIAGDASTVWNFRPLIEAALENLGEEDVFMARRAAAEKLGEHKFEDWLNDAAAVTGGLAVAFTPAPPIAGLLALASALCGTVVLIAEGWKAYRDGQGARAALDPQKCLAGEASWGFFILNIALMILASRLLPAKALQTLDLLQAAEAVAE